MEIPETHECAALRETTHYVAVASGDSDMYDTIRARREVACRTTLTSGDVLSWPNGQIMRERGEDGAWYYPNGGRLRLVRGEAIASRK